MGKMIDWTGQKIGRLTVVSVDSKDIHGHYKWKCVCECGNEVIVFSDNLKKGHTQSCGCIHSEVTSKIKTTHGLRNSSPIYNVWCSMKQRCNDKNCKSYPNYGGRGISICERWNDFKNFSDDMFPTYKKSLTIDRINVNGNYEPNNCRWATQKTQMNNTRRNVFIEYNGEIDTVTNICNKYSINYTTIQSRVRNLGYSYEKAFSIPTKQRKKRTAI
jgi:hypothetical protein